MRQGVTPDMHTEKALLLLLNETFIRPRYKKTVLSLSPIFRSLIRLVMYSLNKLEQ